MRPPPWRVGDLAERTGLTVRTLHHYDEIGLLAPSHRTDTGHRLYTARDVQRLQQIKSLRGLGFSLEQVRDCLSDADFSPRRVIGLHLPRLNEQVEHLQRLRSRLETLAAALDRTEADSVEDFLTVIQEMTMFDKYYTPEQMETIKNRGEAVGAERIREVEAEWPKLMAEVQAEMDKGTDPASATAQQLADRWMGLVREFTGGDPGITQSLKRMYENESNIHGMEKQPMGAMQDYVQRALAVAKAPS